MGLEHCEFLLRSQFHQMNKLGRENFPFSQCYSQYDRDYELFTTLCIVFVHILLHTYD